MLFYATFRRMVFGRACTVPRILLFKGPLCFQEDCIGLRQDGQHRVWETVKSMVFPLAISQSIRWA